MKTILTTAILLLMVSGCATTSPVSQTSMREKQYVMMQSGEASWYSTHCNGGSRTASGMPLNNYAATAAHKTLPFGTKVKVTNVKNGKSEVVKITDRGPYTEGRVIDVTVGVASRLGFKSQGVAKVKLEVLK